jgi:hypothetical protein
MLSGCSYWRCWQCPPLVPKRKMPKNEMQCRNIILRHLIAYITHEGRRKSRHDRLEQSEYRYTALPLHQRATYL